jgi:LysM repeat protein
MRRFIPLMLVLAMTGSVAVWAGNELPPGAVELDKLRQAVDQQSKQIEVLTEQVGRLTRAIEGQKSVEAPAPARPAEAPSAATTSVEAAKPPAESTADAPKAETAPKAEATTTAGGPKHTVAKGETLTSIAKHYNIPIAELKNANKIDNERRLQIGQVLSIPPAKSPDTPDKKDDKKENP